MPHSELHKKKKTKNFVILALIMGWCVAIFIISMIRMAHGADFDPATSFEDERAAHFEKMLNKEETWRDEYYEEEARRQNLHHIRTHNRGVHLDYNQRAERVWFRKWDVQAPLRRILDKIAVRKRHQHVDKMEAEKEEWWADWTAKAEDK